MTKEKSAKIFQRNHVTKMWGCGDADDDGRRRRTRRSKNRWNEILMTR